jgi:predicted CXXCH cytochrome family protein
VRKRIDKPRHACGWVRPGAALVLVLVARVAPALDAPHGPQSVVHCAHCHIVHKALGPVLTSKAANDELCQQCHYGSGAARDTPLLDADQADRSAGTGTSHRWDALVVTGDPLNTTLPTNVKMLPRIDNNGTPEVTDDKLTCSTCHNQHNSNTDFPFLRIPSADNALCGECHGAWVMDSASTWSSTQDRSHPVGIVLDSGSSGLQTPSNLPLEGGNVVCSSCHAMHFVSSGASQDGTADTGTATTLTDSSASWSDDELIGRRIFFLSGANAMRSRPISDNSSDIVAWLDSLQTADGSPQEIAAGDAFTILDSGPTEDSTATSNGSKTALNDNTGGWTPDSLIGGKIYFTSGPNNGLVRDISDNLLNQISWETNVSSNTSSGDTYTLQRPGDACLLRQTNVNSALCLECHNVKMHNRDNTGSSRPENWGSTFTCATCHQPHKTRNIFLVKESITVDPADPATYEGTFDVDLRTVANGWGTNDLADSETPGSGVCEACHANTTVFNNAGAGPGSHDTDSCVGCHPHGDGFKPSAGSCLLCHKTEKGGDRRQVVENDSDGLGDFVRLSGHVSNGLETEIVTEADCEVCHDQGSHQEQVEGTYGVLLKDPDGGSSFTYDGTGGSIESFCLNCHDGSPAPAPPAVPAITIITADDPDDGDQVLSVGDTLTIAFDVNTNEGISVDTHSGVAMDGFFSRSTGTFG